MDDIDIAQAAEEKFRDMVLAAKRSSDAPEHNDGFCLQCEAPTGAFSKRWCDSDCRTDWERERRALKRAPRIIEGQ